MYTTKQKGFTIVELLIVIVVIAILAAISIVAFTGIQQRGRDTSRASDVSNIVKALTAYTADGNNWPASGTAAGTALEGYTTANLSEDVTDKLGTAAASSSDTSTDVYGYTACGTTGATISYIKEQDGNTVNVNAGSGC